MTIKQERLKGNLEKYSFPRLSGTDEEEKAFTYLYNSIKDLDLIPESHSFQFSTFYSRIYPKIAFTLLFLLLLLFYLNLEAILFFPSLIILLCLLLFFANLVRTPENLKIGKKLRSQNLITRIPKKSIYNNAIDNSDPKNIYLFSHVDSKGQRFRIKIRTLSLKYWLFSYICSFCIILIKNLIFPRLNILFLIGLVFFSINLGSTFFIVSNTINNKSNGAIDNASGLITVLELLTHYSEPQNRLMTFNLWFVFTGAEECGTMGIRHFYNKIKNLDKEKSFIINFDSIGKGFDYWGLFINPNKNAELYNTFSEFALQLAFKLNYTNKSFGVRSDGLYLRGKKYRGFGFGDLKGYKFVHSKDDTIDKVDISVIEQLCKFIILALAEIDNRY